VGTIGAAIASALTGFLSLRWWQMPLVFVALVLVVSGPSMLLAHCSLRARNLGPIGQQDSDD
jgi:ABC-type polysaccharide/polyol phosphate export permease